jgi:hypothetical protein
VRHPVHPKKGNIFSCATVYELARKLFQAGIHIYCGSAPDLTSPCETKSIAQVILICFTILIWLIKEIPLMSLPHSPLLFLQLPDGMRGKMVPPNRL